MEVIHKNNDISELVETVTWSGDHQQAARKISLSIVSSSTDKNIPTVTFSMGDTIFLFDKDGEERFRGFVFAKDKSVDGNTMTVTCYDGLIYMLKSSGTYNFKRKTPGSITRKLSSDFGIDTGKLVEGKAINRIFDSESIYNIMMTSYTLESDRTGKQYIPRMHKGKLSVINKGETVAKYELDPQTSVTNASYGEDMENSINRVEMYDKDGKRIGQVSLVGIPGRLQAVYKQAEGENAKESARSMLQGINRTASIDALGDFDCITGNAVVIKEPHTGLNGLFYIDSDEHTFSNGQHMMKLGLSFENMMDRQTGGETD